MPTKKKPARRAPTRRKAAPKRRSVRVQNPGKDSPARALFITGDVNPEYGSGVVFRDKYGLRMHRWDEPRGDGPFRTSRVRTNFVDIPNDVLAEYDWADAPAVASYVGMSTAELRKMAKSRSVKDRVLALEAVAAYHGWDEIDPSPSVLTGAQIMRMWGNTFTRRGRKTGRSPKRGARGRFA